MPVSSATSSTSIPKRNASATYQSLRLPAIRSSCRSFARSSSVSTLASIGFRPSVPISRPRSAFCSDSWNVRPIAITSPTDFICVVRRSAACGNFSNVNRGTFVTT